MHIINEHQILSEFPTAKSCERVARSQGFRLIQAWREAFCERLRWKTGKWVLEGFDWHVFSAGFADALTGNDAYLAFREVARGVVFVRPEGEVVYRVDFEEPPSLPSGMDLYFFDEDLDWTFVTTHEQEYGPYFVRRPNEMWGGLGQQD